MKSETIRKLIFSNSASAYSVELNDKYPNMTTEEYLEKLDEFIERNEDKILEEANEYIDKNLLIEEGMDLDDLDDEDEDKETDSTPVNPVSDENSSTEENGETTDEKPTDDEPEESTNDEGVKKSNVVKVKPTETKTVGGFRRDKDGKAHFTDNKHTFKGKRADTDSEDDDLIVVEDPKTGKKTRRLLMVNNPEDEIHDIHTAVDLWYNRERGINGSKEHLKKHTLLERFVTTEVTEMDALFAFADVPNIDLSSWDTSNVKNMEGMFYHSTFNNDSIENWDVSNCIKFTNMFVGSKFTGCIDNWKPGSRPVPMKDKDGNIIGEINPDGTKKVDSNGNMVPKMRMVQVKLPEVGARKVEIMSDAKYTALKKFDKLGQEGKSIADVEAENATDEVEESKKHVLTIDEFVNEGFYDKVKAGIKKGVDFIKDKFRAIAVKVNDFFVVNFSTETGKIIPVTDAATTLNYIETSKPKGVTAFTNSESPLLVDGIDSKATIEERSDRYGWITKGTREYDNYVEFIKMVAGDGVNVSEARIPLGKKNRLGETELDIQNISNKELESEINRLMLDVPGESGKDFSPALCIYGAPGIGKTTIPKKIIDEWNNAEGHEHRKKAIIVIECGDLELGGFNIPIPKPTSLSQTIIANKDLRDRLIKQFGSEEKLKEIGDFKVLQTHEAPKTWLPVYYKNLPEDEFEAAQEAANGRNLLKLVPNETGFGYKRKKIDTTEGGIIMFDEFLRADPELFKTICQLVMNRSIGNGEWILGDKWAIILCSNRPIDDDEVKDRYDRLPPAMSNRYLGGMYNFIPNFEDWLKWAKTDDYFDDDTINFISGEITPVDNHVNKDEYEDADGNPITVYKNWHTIDKDRFKTGEAPIITTPRGWDALMHWVHLEKEIEGVDSIIELDMKKLRRKAKAIIGNEIGDAYVDYMEDIKQKYISDAKPKTKSFFYDDIDSIDTSKYGVGEMLKDVLQYINNHFSERIVSISTSTEVGEKFLRMAKNVDKFYGESIGSEVKTLHSNIINKYDLKNDTNMVEKLLPYVKFIVDKFKNSDITNGIKIKPNVKDFFTEGVKSDFNKVYGCKEATEDIIDFIEKNYDVNSVLSSNTVGDEFLTMAKNLDNLYSNNAENKEIIENFHNKIVQEVYQLRDKDVDSKPIKKKLLPYLKHISDSGYDVSFLPANE